MKRTLSNEEVSPYNGSDDNNMERVFSSTVTITFGEQAENHVLMQKLGSGLATKGYSVEELRSIETKMQEKGKKCELVTTSFSIEQEEIPQLIFGRKCDSSNGLAHGFSAKLIIGE